MTTYVYRLTARRVLYHMGTEPGIDESIEFFSTRVQAEEEFRMYTAHRTALYVHLERLALRDDLSPKMLIVEALESRPGDWSGAFDPKSYSKELLVFIRPLDEASAMYTPAIDAGDLVGLEVN